MGWVDYTGWAFVAVGAGGLLYAVGYSVGVWVRHRVQVRRSVALAAGIADEVRLSLVVDDPTEIDGPANPWAVCGCGHLWLRHDVDEYPGDGSETCCVEGCDQNGCPGRSDGEVLQVDGPPAPAWVPLHPAALLLPALDEDPVAQRLGLDYTRPDRYADMGLVPYGLAEVHSGCLAARRDAAADWICGRCAESFVRAAIR